MEKLAGKQKGICPQFDQLQQGRLQVGLAAGAQVREHEWWLQVDVWSVIYVVENTRLAPVLVGRADYRCKHLSAFMT